MPTFGTDGGNLTYTDAAGTIRGTGNNLANVLLPGAAWNLQETSTNVRAQLRWHDDEFYIADNWKVTPRLTLDLGLRWSFLDAPYQPNNQITNFQPILYNPALSPSDACNGLWIVAGTDPCGAANAQFGTNFSSGTPGPGRALVNNNNHMIAPRVGIAWDPWGDGNTAVRIGAWRVLPARARKPLHAGGNAPFAVTASYQTASGWRCCRAAIRVPLLQVVWIARDIVPVSWQWNVSIQRSLARDTTLELGYVGNHAIPPDLELRPQPDRSAELVSRVVLWRAADVQAAGFYAFNNYSVR